jgi:hypothetical protein
MKKKIQPPRSFNVSDKVVCVDDVMTPLQLTWCSEPIVAGRVYVVRESFQTPNRGLHSVRLVGITLEKMPDGSEMGWDASRFRTLAEVRAAAIQGVVAA